MCSAGGGPGGAAAIEDKTEVDIIALRRTIYLTIMSAMGFEETTHKLMKLTIPEGQEHELINMVIECCSQEKSYQRHFGLIAQRLCMVARRFQVRSRPRCCGAGG